MSKKLLSNLSFCRMSAALEFDCAVCVCRMWSGVLVGQPRVAAHANVDARHDCVCCPVLATATSENLQEMI